MNWILSLAKSILKSYIFIYVAIHVLMFITPQTCNFFIFQNIGTLYDNKLFKYI